MEGEIMDDFKFKCVKCKKHYTEPKCLIICEDCDPESRKNKRSKALGLILEEKKWWQIFS